MDDMIQFENRPWRLARGDKDIIILPSSFIPELNRLPRSVANSREYHADNVTSGPTGTDVVRPPPNTMSKSSWVASVPPCPKYSSPRPG
ncbi:hypothetical protein PG991_001783 [Apiospora marii]|uniref:Uncharacterized protein n=1 Tax=Apiospora marii TaxID=335849 RepID=A0ABR1SN16_9PEZI